MTLDELKVGSIVRRTCNGDQYIEDVPGVFRRGNDGQCAIVTNIRYSPSIGETVPFLVLLSPKETQRKTDFMVTSEKQHEWEVI